MIKTKRLLLVIGLFGILLIACKNESKNETEVNKTLVSKNNKNAGAQATIQLDDGSTLEMKERKPRGNSNAPSRFTVNITDLDGVIIMLKLDANDTPLEETSYEKSPNATLVLTSTSSVGALGSESYRSYNEDADGNEGEAKITLTSFGNNQAEGNFKGILYSPSHKKASIEGNFSTTWKSNW